MHGQRWRIVYQLMVILLFGGGLALPVLAQDKPTGELRIALAFLGAQRLIPWNEDPSGGVKQYQLLIYDHLVGCTEDGQLSSENGIAQSWRNRLTS